MPPVPLRRPLCVLALTCATALSACGTGDSVTVADTRPVTVQMTEFRLSPQELRLPAGRRTLTVRNAGTMVHRFELRTADGRRRLARTPHLRPGESAAIAVSLTAGEYVIRCSQPRHNTLGEHGIVRVG